MTTVSASKMAADVHISNGSCSIEAERLIDIERRAKALLRDSYEYGFSHLPIDRSALFSKTTALLTERAICQTLVAQSGATENNHNGQRNHYKTNRLDEEGAAKIGVKAKRVQVTKSCNASCDWAGSFYYNDVETCEDVFADLKRGIPTLMYSVAMPAAEADDAIKDLRNAPYYTNYANAGPVQCGTGNNYRDAFHALQVSKALPKLEFVLRGIHGRNWSAWKMLKSCTGFAADDFKFNFGIRVFIPLNVDVDGRVEDRTLILEQAIAASANIFAPFIPQQMQYERVIGGTAAKKLFLEAKSRGWKLER